MSTYTQSLADDSFAIFLFHGVIRQPRSGIRNYTHKHLTLDRFVSILRDLRQAGTPVSIPDIVAATQQGRLLPKRGFSITFDDGFENNYSVAAPALRDLKIPAIFYITTHFVEANSLSWIDMIESAVEKQAAAQLSLPEAEISGTFETREQQIDLLDRIRQYVKSNPSLDPYGFADRICQQLSLKAIEPDPQLDQKMTWTQVRELSNDELFTIGGHSHTHRILSYLRPPELEQELATSLLLLRDHLGISVEHYSYPEGLRHCYSDSVISELRRHGIICSPTAEPGINHVGDDLFRLKRIPVVD